MGEKEGRIRKPSHFKPRCALPLDPAVCCRQIAGTLRLAESFVGRNWPPDPEKKRTYEPTPLCIGAVDLPFNETRRMIFRAIKAIVHCSEPLVTGRWMAGTLNQF